MTGIDELEKDKEYSGRASRKVFVKTYGCQMNVYDSERMGDALARDGYAATEDMSEADLVVLNTCHIREKAAEKVYSELGRVRKVKQLRAARGKRTLVAVTGCVAQAEGAEMLARAPVVDVVAGPQSYHRLGSYLDQALLGEPVVATGFEIAQKFAELPPASPRASRARGVAAFLTIQEGCDKFCTFCVVPYTRGAEVSRPVGQIVAEASLLAARGVREITLLGQNVNAWHGAGRDGRAWRLGELLGEIARLDGVERLRYTTSHPIDMDESLIRAHRDLPQLMPYLHLPVQSGSDRVLKAMNRRHDRAYYLDIVARLRESRPDLALSGDFIVGFPGETDEDFEQTLDLVRHVRYAQAFSFKYSARPGTPGADRDDQIAEPVKAERLARLQRLLNARQHAFNQSLVGSGTTILLEKQGRAPDQLIGRSPWLQPVVVEAPVAAIGEIVPVRITRAGPNSLSGELV
jgi:tRNA-2-methylthio-N6-dimethylallyladenosine synthase